nr:unnamed protein product [Callosobruchus analis]
MHRDVRGSNILLTREGEVKLCDFGLSTMTRNQGEKLTTVLGSPCWMAPELVSANADKRNACYDNRVSMNNVLFHVVIFDQKASKGRCYCCNGQ